MSSKHNLFTGDKCVDSSHVQKVIFVTGKHFYELDKYRKEHSVKDVAIVRLEELCPFPTYYLKEEISKYKKAKCKIFLNKIHSMTGTFM